MCRVDKEKIEWLHFERLLRTRRENLSRPKLTFFYIVEPPQYEIFAATLLASIRTHFDPNEVAAVGYCPAHRMAELNPAVIKAHEIMGAEVRPMQTEGMWDTSYPHGNKIIACTQERDSEFSAFVDSDVMFLRANDPSNLVSAGQVSCSAAASMVWTDQDIWTPIYEVFGMTVPEERIRLMRRGRNAVPYFSAGLVVFPEKAGTDHKRFPDVWYETARILDREDWVPKRRPYLDQLTLPIAIQRSGLSWNILPEEQHYILGGKLRGKPLPEDRDIYTAHYRNDAILRETGLQKVGQKMLKQQTGVRFVGRLNDTGTGDEDAE
jgi:hypothetical protein